MALIGPLEHSNIRAMRFPRSAIGMGEAPALYLSQQIVQLPSIAVSEAFYRHNVTYHGLGIPNGYCCTTNVGSKHVGNLSSVATFHAAVVDATTAELLHGYKGLSSHHKSNQPLS